MEVILLGHLLGIMVTRRVGIGIRELSQGGEKTSNNSLLYQVSMCHIFPLLHEAFITSPLY